LYILGFDCYGHDSAAALLDDGEMVAMAEEERFNRDKHTMSFPKGAIRYCLEEAGIGIDDVDHIAYYWDTGLHVWDQLWHIVRYFPKSLHLVRSRFDQNFMPMMTLRRAFRDELGMTEKAKSTRIRRVEHHAAHAASTFLLSPYEEAAILSLDAVGEWTTTWFGVGEGSSFRKLDDIGFPHSIGMVYGSITEYLGFRFSSDEGKVMGLAPYGDPDRYIGEFRKIIRLEPNGRFSLDMRYFDYHVYGRGHWFSDHFVEVFGPPRQRGQPIEKRHEDVAAALQRATEEVGLHMANHLHSATGKRNLCIAGGVGLNSVMNGKMLELSPFKSIFIQPAASDAGTALGAALVVHSKVLGLPRPAPMRHAYWGPGFTDQQIEDVLRTYGQRLTYRRVEDPARLGAETVAQGKILGWFQGRMEFGPRALGNRSILADPRGMDTKDVLNARVKHRESFRPFAPSVLEERTGEYFSSDHVSPYMILVYDVLPEKRPLVPAITHVDGTGRVQTVGRETNPLYWRLIKQFEDITGVGLVLNTSFNVMGQPIVCRPEQAIDCFLSTGIDRLIIGSFVVDKAADSGET
jgi:carbamoyltransferase